jgi:hypothetical protein
MNTDTKLDRKILLSTLWIFLSVNYIYCDVLSHMETETLKDLVAGNVGGIEITQGFLLSAALLMEIPFAMIVLSRVLKYRPNRWANIIAGSFMAFVQVSTMFVGSAPTLHYLFYSAVEVVCNLLIVWLAWKWGGGDA